jgi:hypothetical protein
MGVHFSACQNAKSAVEEQLETVEAKFDNAEGELADVPGKVAKVQEAVGEEQTALQQLAEDVAKAVTDAEKLLQDAEANVADIVGGGETVREAVEGVKGEAVATEVAGKKVEGDAVVAEEKAEEVVAAIEETADLVTDLVKQGVEAVTGVMDAAHGAHGAVVVEFVEGKGTVHTVEFKNRSLGLALDRSSIGCCGKASKAKIVVKTVQKGGQAEQLGIKRSWVLKQVDGTEVTGLEQAQTLLNAGVVKLPAA